MKLEASKLIIYGFVGIAEILGIYSSSSSAFK